MTTLENQILPTCYPFNQRRQPDRSPRCTLKWRQGQLLVTPPQHSSQLHLPAIESEEWLAECLKNSPVRLIRIDPNLGDASLKRWADACEQASKPLFLRLPSARELPQNRSPLSWWLKRLIDWVAATLLLLVFGPVILVIVLMMAQAQQPIFIQEWCVGERGKIFKLFKFRILGELRETNHSQALSHQKGQPERKDDSITPLGYWMCKYSLDKLPQLFNVLRGEMSLVGPYPWRLVNAVRISPEGKQRLNALPGITGAWQEEAMLNLLDIDAIARCDLKYLSSWSLWKDIKILLQSVPKSLSGFSAYKSTTTT